MDMPDDPARNLYAPPQAPVRSMPVEDGHAFYVVARRKFLLLFFATLGLYQVYWFYRHWAQYRTRHGERMLPVLRGIFAIFFAHRLFAAIDAALQSSPHGYRWQPRHLATVFVLLSLLSYALSKLAANGIGWPLTDVLNLLVLAPLAWPLWAAQRAANAACGDRDGDTNAALGVGNWLWLGAGAVLWLLALFGTTLSPEDLA